MRKLEEDNQAPRMKVCHLREMLTTTVNHSHLHQQQRELQELKEEIIRHQPGHIRHQALVPHHIHWHGVALRGETERGRTHPYLLQDKQRDSMQGQRGQSSEPSGYQSYQRVRFSQNHP